MIRHLPKILAVLLTVSFSNVVMTTPAWAQKQDKCKEGTTKIPGDGKRCKCEGGTWECKKIR